MWGIGGITMSTGGGEMEIGDGEMEEIVRLTTENKVQLQRYN